MRRLGILALLLLLSACAIGQPAPAVTTYDFGLGAAPFASSARLMGSLGIEPVRAPAVFDGTGILYRLAYRNSARLEMYSRSRWAATPAQLLTQRLRQKLGHVARGGVILATDGVAADHVLRVELEQFSQVFDAPNRSRALVQMRASLIDAKTSKLIAQSDFHAEQPARANAAGAAAGLREASDSVFDAMAQWLAKVAKGVRHTAS